MLAARREGNRREMLILSREERIRYATVDLIPQEGRTSGPRRRIVLPESQRGGRGSERKIHVPSERRGPGECANGGGVR